MYRSQLKISPQEQIEPSNNHNNNINNENAHAPIKSLTLRDNQLHGSILVGNYHHLTHLEVTDNELEVLDLSTLNKLETLKCNHNRLMELILNGEHLTTVSLQCNNLHTLNVTHTPKKLKYFNVSHNFFTELPLWLSDCSELQTLNSSNNRLQNINAFLTNYNIKQLQQLHLQFNRLQTLTTQSHKLPQQLATLKELHLQANELQKLPDNFFDVFALHLNTLNLSSNKLNSLPRRHQQVASNICIEQMLLSSNRLTERIFDDVLMQAHKLRVLHLAYNKINMLPEHFLNKCLDLEVLVLSGNMLQHLPANINQLSKLQVLRVHSNLLLTTPSLCKLTQLKVLDLAHNHLDHINLLQLVPAQLKYLDLSCNLQLQVDEQELVACQNQRKWSLIDVSGKNREGLPTLKLQNLDKGNSKHLALNKPPWIVGFSETPGLRCRKLLISQLRLSNFLSNVGLFGMFECVGACSASNMSALIRQVPQMLQQQLQKSPPIVEAMKSTLNLLCGKLNGSNERNKNIAATLCHITRESIQPTVKASKNKTRIRHYVLRLVYVGNLRAFLVRKTSNICITTTTTNSCQTAENEQEMASKKIILSNEDEYLVICNSSLWEVLDIERVAREIRKEDNMVLAAKRVQNIAQSFGAQQSLSVILLRFKNLGTDVDHLLRELKEMSRQKPSVSCFPRKQPQGVPAARSERSSPSGQSDHLGVGKTDGKEYASLAHVEEVLSEDGDDGIDETESMLSEEQFKCWEYMLEQNTQLLFDKELNTISKAFSAQNPRIIKEPKYAFPATDDIQLMEEKLQQNSYNKLKSVSSPQLLYAQNDLLTGGACQQHLSFLPKPLPLGVRKNALGYNYLKNRLQDSLHIGSFVGSSYSKLAGGPNAAYFGSVQRQVPFNFEYDLAAVTNECAMLDDDDNLSDEHESRMSKYWGVATTEL